LFFLLLKSDTRRKEKNETGRPLNDLLVVLILRREQTKTTTEKKRLRHQLRRELNALVVEMKESVVRWAAEPSFLQEKEHRNYEGLRLLSRGNGAAVAKAIRSGRSDQERGAVGANECVLCNREREVREAERGRETGYRSTMEASGLKPDETEGG